MVDNSSTDSDVGTKPVMPSRTVYVGPRRSQFKTCVHIPRKVEGVCINTEETSEHAHTRNIRLFCFLNLSPVPP